MTDDYHRGGELLTAEPRTWWRLLQLLGPGVIPPRSLMRDLAAELCLQASQAGGPAVTLDFAALAWWIGISEAGTRVALENLAAMGLVRRRPGRPEVWELTMSRAQAELPAVGGNGP